MRFYTREGDGDSTWAPVAIVMSILAAGLLIGYFFWYAPSQNVQTAPPATVNVNTPSAAQPDKTTVVMPGTPGPAGATGATGAKGSPGSTGDTGSQGSQGSDGAPGAAGSPGQPGQPGQDAPKPADPDAKPGG